MDDRCVICGAEMIDGLCSECDANILLLTLQSNREPDASGDTDADVYETLRKLRELDDLIPIRPVVGLSDGNSLSPADENLRLETEKEITIDRLRKLDDELSRILSFNTRVKSPENVDFFTVDFFAIDAPAVTDESEEAASPQDAAQDEDVAEDVSDVSTEKADGNETADNSSEADDSSESPESALTAGTEEQTPPEEKSSEDSEASHSEETSDANPETNSEKVISDDGTETDRSVVFHDDGASSTDKEGASDSDAASVSSPDDQNSDNEAVLCQFCGSPLPGADYNGKCSTCKTRYRKGRLMSVPAGASSVSRHVVSILILTVVLVFLARIMIRGASQDILLPDIGESEQPISSADILAPAEPVTTGAEPSDVHSFPLFTVTTETTSTTVPDVSDAESPTTTAATVPTTVHEPDNSADAVTDEPTEPDAEPVLQAEPYGETSAEFFDPGFDYSVGDTFLLGSYEQDNADPQKEYIEWMILKTENHRILAVSKYGLDCMPYHSNPNPVTWKNCALRKWLNGEFLDEAFSETERERIISAKIDNSGNRLTGVSGGDDTYDRIFCLSLDEYTDLFETPEDRLVIPTEYAVSRGAYLWEESNCGYFWLRTPGRGLAYATYGTRTGKTAEYGTGTTSKTVSVRPALYLSV